MHPVLAEFLSLANAQNALQATPATEASSRAFQEAARLHPERAKTVLNATSATHPPPEVQQDLLFLATHAVLLNVAESPVLGPKLQAARTKLLEEGATLEEADFLLANLVLDDAFGFLEETEDFDERFFAETLDSVPSWASLTEESLEAMREAFKASSKDTWVPQAAQALFEAAWADGPGPISPEHVEAALEFISDEKKPNEAFEAMEAVLKSLHEQGIIGPLRRERLRQTYSPSA